MHANENTKVFKPALVVGAALLFAVFAICCGCSGQQDTQQGGQREKGASSLFSSSEWPDNEVTDGVPVPDFGSSPTEVSTGEGFVKISYTRVVEDSVARYVEQLKAAGFNYKVRESKSADIYSYAADDGEDYDKTMSLTYQSDGSFEMVVLVASKKLVSKGGDDTNVRVPTLRGLSEEDATSMLEELGLAVKTRTGKSGEAAKGEVYDQSIASGTEVAQGTTVTVYVAS